VLVRVRLGILLGSGLNFRKPPNYTTTLLHPTTLLPYYPTTLPTPFTLLPYYPTTLLPYYPTTLLPYYPTTLLPYYPTTLLPYLLLLPYYPTTLLPYYPTTPLPYYPTTLLPYYRTTLLPYYPTTLLPYYPTTLLPYYLTTILLYYHTTLLPYYPTTLLPYYPTTGYVGWVRGPLLLSLPYVLMQLWIPHDTCGFDWIFGATNTNWGSSTDAGVVTCDLISSSFKVTDGVSAFSFSRSTKSLRRGVSFSLPPKPRSFKSCLIIVFIEASSTD
jgi:hypothetical protein